MSQWSTASTRAATTRETRRPNRRVVGPPVHHSAGDLHAYRPGDSETACHRELSGLKLWPTEDFRRGFDLHRCRECLEVARN